MILLLYYLLSTLLTIGNISQQPMRILGLIPLPLLATSPSNIGFTP